MDVVKTWKGKDVCRYKGFRCDHLPDGMKERTVSAVSFTGFKFEGPELFLEGFMDELDDIAVFHVNSNFFVGPIPEKINRQRFFFEMDLSNNKLPGKFVLKFCVRNHDSALLWVFVRYVKPSNSLPESSNKV